VLSDATVRCWGFSFEGALGYGHARAIGDDESPGLSAPVNIGAGRTASAIAVGDFHSCALLDDATVRCWGFGDDGRLGYGNIRNIGDDEHPGSVGPVDLGAERTAKAIAAGGAHTCAILDNDTVRCWGYAFNGQLGYGNVATIGDGETPGSAGPVNLGAGRTAKAITAGSAHTCALLDDDSVRCWGAGLRGQLGYGNTSGLGDFSTPDQVRPVDLGAQRTARAISAGLSQTCALLDDANVRCWGAGANGRLGYANTEPIGDNETPGSAGPVNLGTGRTAAAIAVGGTHTCARLEDSGVRCWGLSPEGQLGYANRRTIGDDETPGSVARVNLGRARSALAIALGDRHTCARLDDGSVRCWGYGANGRLGLCSERNIGDDETPGSTGPVGLGGPGVPACPPGAGGAAYKGPPRPAQTGGGSPVYPMEDEDARRGAYRACVRRVGAHARREVARARRLSGRRRARARRHLKRHRSRSRRACVKRHGRTPGRVTGLRARALSRRRIELSFFAPGSDGAKEPAARSYLIKQSRRRIRGARGFRRAQSLCKGRCRFADVTEVGAKITLKVTDLRRRTTYYYAVAARDNVTGKLGRRSRPAKVKTR